MRKLILPGAAGLLWMCAATSSANSIPFRGGEILAAEFSAASPQIENFDRHDFDLPFDNLCFALVTVRLTPGRNLSVYDYSLSLFGRSYPCVAVRTGDGSFDSARREIRGVASGAKLGMLFVVDSNALGRGATEKAAVRCNAPGSYPSVTLPLTNRGGGSFTKASAVPDSGSFPKQ